VPTAQAVADATATLEGMAVYDGEEIDVHVRVAHFGDKVYLDLGNDTWEAVEIGATGWRIVPTPPVMFRRPQGLAALPHPAPGGSIDGLRGFVNVADEHWPLVAGFVVALLSVGPYAVLVLLGEQGSGKSTAARVVRRLVDPNSSPLRNKPRSDHDLAIAATNTWVLSFDNLSSLPEWLSNTLCTIATGGGFSTRMLYTDDEERIFDARRPVILNGIGDIVARSDLLDRSLLVPLPAIDAKESEEAFWARFDKAWPQLLGAVLDATVAAVAGVDDVELDETPRMVDFTRWATAAETTMGLEDGAVLQTYLANRATADQTALEASPIGRFVEQVVATTPVWEGSTTELLNEINRLADAADKVSDDRVGPTRRQKEWPKAANSLSNRLKLLAPNLRRVGVDVAIDRDETGSRVTITRTG
jgi:energy-coupling factor transporter ATP-binding protein EcfA2